MRISFLVYLYQSNSHKGNGIQVIWNCKRGKIVLTLFCPYHFCRNKHGAEDNDAIMERRFWAFQLLLGYYQEQRATRVMCTNYPLTSRVKIRRRRFHGMKYESHVFTWRNVKATSVTLLVALPLVRNKRTPPLFFFFFLWEEMTPPLQIKEVQ